MELYTFENLPQAVHQLSRKLEAIEKLLQSGQANEKDKTDKLLTIDEAAEYLRLSKQTLYIKVSKREIPFMKKGNRLYFSNAELLEFVKEGRKSTLTEIKAESEKAFTNKKG